MVPSSSTARAAQKRKKREGESRLKDIAISDIISTPYRTLKKREKKEGAPRRSPTIPTAIMDGRAVKKKEKGKKKRLRPPPQKGGGKRE